MAKKAEKPDKDEMSFEQKNRDTRLKKGYEKLKELEEMLRETGANDWLDFERHIRDLKAHLIARMKGQ